MKQVFEECTIGNIPVRNRIMRSATWEGKADEDGHITQKLWEVYEELAESGIGLICTGYARVMKEEQPNPHMMAIYEDAFVEEYRRLTDMVHQKGAKMMMQLVYGGTRTNYQVVGRTILSPSEIPVEDFGLVGKTASPEDIQKVVRAYADAAARAQASGFDGVQLHLAHNYFLNQFLSPYYNKREDAYGGNLENRMRIVKEIYQAVREKVGEAYPVWVKITCADFKEGGISPKETLEMCKIYQKWGIAAIEVSGNIHGRAERLTGKCLEGKEIRKQGYFYEFAAEIAEAVDTSMILTGGVRSPEDMEQMLAESGIAAFGLCRPLLAEPKLVKRWMEGDRKPAKCVHCSKCRTGDGNQCTVFSKK